MTEMAERITIVSAERVQRRAGQAAGGAQPRGAASSCWCDTGLADHVLPELPALQLEIDEHHQHKDVYEHSLTVLDQAIALEDGPDGRRCPAPTWCCGWPRCCTTSASRPPGGSSRAAG